MCYLDNTFYICNCNSYGAIDIKFWLISFCTSQLVSYNVDLYDTFVKTMRNWITYKSMHMVLPQNKQLLQHRCRNWVWQIPPSPLSSGRGVYDIIDCRDLNLKKDKLNTISQKKLTKIDERIHFRYHGKLLVLWCIW